MIVVSKNCISYWEALTVFFSCIIYIFSLDVMEGVVFPILILKIS